MPDPKKPTLSLGVPDVTKPEVKPEADPALSVQGRTVSVEEFDELKAQNDELSAQLHVLMAEIRSRRAPDAHLSNPLKTDSRPIEGDEPLFDPSEPHGVVTGDSEVGYVQNGHQFSRDRRYLATEANRGVARPFKPGLVGVVLRPQVPPVN